MEQKMEKARPLVWEKIYPNQLENGKEIMKEFEENEKLIGLVLSPPQAGKTGMLCACIKESIEKGIGYENIFIITGLSSLEWKDQTRERVPKELRENVFHRPDLMTKFIEKMRGKHNVLILIDEVQIASNENQTICNAFNELNLFNFDHLEENMIKIVQFSATPNGTLYDISNSEDEMYKYGFLKIFEGGEKYTGIKELYNLGRIKQATSINGYSDYLNEIEYELGKYKSPKYHFIRLQRGESFEKTIMLFCNKFPETNYELYTQEGLSTKELDELLENEPDLHTFIFIKERARCAKTFNPKKHIGFWYERCTKTTCDDIITQGLLGRACGYNDNNESTIYTNLESVEKYIKLMETDFSEDIIWKSSSTIEFLGECESKGTINGLFGGDNNYHEQRKIDTLEWKGETGYEEACMWLKNEKKKEKGPYWEKLRKFKKTQPKNGFYNGGNIFKYKIVDYSDVIPEKVLLKNEVCQLIRCYSDINDPNSLIHLVCYRD